ncbi:DNA-dependent RNA polymerase subunit epsilon [Shouchella patagoniensis]|uniref:DNA-dependent RNA polymerase subunit epsilon n=1 Tax=Shouchella patagoniensis TaxID=228576 RepID=UPI000995038D|nr:DNA-directed RNA polymerase subunit epsilon [Shouchella patagoniensis]
MIFKVYYQEDASQAPVRERTESLYIEAESESDVRLKLAPEGYNIEYVTALTGAYLSYEKEHEDYKVVTRSS